MSAYVAQARYIVPNMLNPWFGSAHTTLTHATHHMPTYIVAVRPNIMFMLVGSSLGRDHICSVTSLSEPHTDGETGCIFCHDRSYVRPFACSNLMLCNIPLPCVRVVRSNLSVCNMDSTSR